MVAVPMIIPLTPEMKRHPDRGRFVNCRGRAFRAFVVFFFSGMLTSYVNRVLATCAKMCQLVVEGRMTLCVAWVQCHSRYTNLNNPSSEARVRPHDIPRLLLGLVGLVEGSESQEVISDKPMKQ